MKWNIFQNICIEGLTFTERLKYSIGYKTQKIHKLSCALQKQKPREIKYKILDEENKIGSIILGHVTVRWKGRDAIGNNNYIRSNLIKLDILTKSRGVWKHRFLVPTELTAVTNLVTGANLSTICSSKYRVVSGYFSGYGRLTVLRMEGPVNLLKKTLIKLCYIRH